jgi:hypothetical protein
MRNYDPYLQRFPRGRILNLYHQSNVHRLLRDKYEPHFRQNNPNGYHHDLGAQDVFLDNFGLIFSEQFNKNGTYVNSIDFYLNTVRFLLQRWCLLKSLVLSKEPWWGTHFNSKSRQANAEEPRGLLRLMSDDDLARLKPSVYGALPWPQANVADLLEDDIPLFEYGDEESYWKDPWEKVVTDDASFGRYRRLHDWNPGLMIDPDTDWRERGQLQERLRIPGVSVPPNMQGPVKELRLLPPREATPDLPIR